MRASLKDPILCSETGLVPIFLQSVESKLEDAMKAWLMIKSAVKKGPGGERGAPLPASSKVEDHPIATGIRGVCCTVNLFIIIIIIVSHSLLFQ